MKISVCMIVRNEEKVLEHAIKSTIGLADEVVILDTGSTDGTIELAKSLGAKVIEGGDRMHKGQCRNTSMVHASGDWIVILDADEQIADPSGLKSYIARMHESAAQAAYVQLQYMDGNNRPTLSYRQMRCWRKGSYEYKYRAHELPVLVTGTAGEIRYTDYVFEHRPPAGRSWKSKYTLDRLLMDVEEHPSGGRPLYYLGRQYMYRSKWKEGIEALERYLLNPGYDEGDAWRDLSACYNGIDDKKMRTRTLMNACLKNPQRREWWVELATEYKALGQGHVAAGLLLCALAQPEPTSSYKRHHWYGSPIYDLLARCLWSAREYKKGHKYAKIALDLDPDNARLKDNLLWFERKLEE